MDNCVFCKIVSRELPSNILAENDNFIAFVNTEPVATHHYLICPKKHVKSFMEIDSSLNMNLMFDFIQTIIRDKKIDSAYKIVVNGGEYLSIEHLHFHLLAGKLEDEKNLLNHL